MMQRSTLERVKQRFEQQRGTARLFLTYAKDWLTVTAIREVHDDHVFVIADSPNSGKSLEVYAALDQIVSLDLEIADE